MFSVEKIIEAINQKLNYTTIKCGDDEMLCILDYPDAGKVKTDINEEVYLYIYVDFNEMIIGPFFRKNKIGCPVCFKERRNWNKRQYEYVNNSNNVVVGTFKMNRYLIQNIVNTLWKRSNSDCSHTLDYYRINCDNNINLYNFWAVNACKHCHCKGLEDDVEIIREGLNKDLYVEKYGAYYPKYDYRLLQKSLSYKNTDSNFVIYQNYNVEKFFSISSFFRLKNEDYYGIGIGSGVELKKTKMNSYFESFERYGGMHPRGRELLCKYSTFNELKEKVNVVDPEIFIKDVLGNNLDIIHYTKDTKINWIKAYSYKDKTEVYLPESLAYYKFDDNYLGHKCKIYKGCSNGNALGSTILDSVYYALLEVIERDAFLNHWYLKHTPQKIDIDSIGDMTVKKLVEKLIELEYKISIFDITMDERIPTVLIYCEGLSHKQFASYITAASNHNPISAVISALNEMLLALDAYAPNIEEIKRNAKKIKKIGVHKLTDHPILYSLQSEKHLFNFLNKPNRTCSFREIYTEYFNDDHRKKVNLKDVVKNLLHKLVDLFGDVYIVRQTPYGYKELQLEVIKVLIPNVQQLWFGEENRMISLARINQVKKYWNCCDRDIEINRAPHPFP